MARAAEDSVTLERLKEQLVYNPATGLFTWNKTGLTAGSMHGSGYIVIRVDGLIYQAHRLAVFYMTGVWPEQDTDHRDRNKSNNVWSNLRVAARMENTQNQDIRKNNKSGYIGVDWHKASNKWRARINAYGKTVVIGYFHDPKEASDAYQEYKRNLHHFQPGL